MDAHVRVIRVQVPEAIHTLEVVCDSRGRLAGLIDGSPSTLTERSGMRQTL